MFLQLVAGNSKHGSGITSAWRVHTLLHIFFRIFSPQQRVLGLFWLNPGCKHERNESKVQKSVAAASGAVGVRGGPAGTAHWTD